MGNLNAEQIKKALECCYVAHCCEGCHFDNMCLCVDKLGVEAFALIKSQEQRIAGLTEENEGLYRLIDEKIQECQKWQDRINIECKYTEAITVRKMRERLKNAFPSIAEAIDYFANELLNGEGMCHEK